MSSPDQRTCRSKVSLATLATGMAKQHERYQDALQELVDNAVSSIVMDESYFEDPADPIKVVVSIHRSEETVRTTVADNGPGIDREALQNEIFRTGNKSASEGILNNVGWGLKASIAWFEQTLSQAEQDPDDDWFQFVTRTSDSPPYSVRGPITGDLPISQVDEKTWRRGLEIGDYDIDKESSGTRVHVSCSRKQFGNDVWPSAKSLEIKAQTLREELGVKFRRLLEAHPENEIYIDYCDETNGNSGSLDVVPIFPKFVSNGSEPPTPYQVDTFEVEGDEGTFEIEFERGTIDFEAMTSEFADDYPGLFTTSGRFRTRYRPNQSKQGVDIYANGRVLMTSVFTSLFDLTRNNEYNYFGGEVRIKPTDESLEVPTDNKKIRIDTNSTLWQNLREILSSEEYQPEGKRYGNTKNESRPDREDLGENDDGEHNSLSDNAALAELDTNALSEAEGVFTLHQQDSRKLEKSLQSFDAVPEGEGFVDVTITSPPYFDLKDYGYEADQQLGQEESYDHYLEQMREVFNQVYSVTKESGTLWVVVNTFKSDGEIVQLPSDIASICQNLSGIDRCPECNETLDRDRLHHQLRCPDCEFSYERNENSWLLQDIVIWDKTRALPYNSDGQFRNVFEYILCFSKSDSFEFNVDRTRVADPAKFKQWWVEYPERYHPRGKVPSNIWEYVTPSQGSFGVIESLDHPAPFPTGLVERILRLTTKPESVVLDPFAGSGTVPAVAEIMDRRSIGFELSPKYCAAYPDVKDEIEQKYGERLSSRTSKQQEDLAKVIGGLRQVKHVRELLRKHAKAQNLASTANLTIHTAFHICQNIDIDSTDSSEFIESDIYYIVDDDIEKETKVNLLQSLRSIADNGISSSYGIDPLVNVFTTSEFLQEAATNSTEVDADELYVYPNGRHYDYNEKISLAEWIERAVGSNQWQQSYAHNEWPPIVSNVGLSVRNPRKTEKSDENNVQSTNQIVISGPDELAFS